MCGGLGLGLCICTHCSPFNHAPLSPQLWSTADGGHCGTMRGHRRGLWCVKFSPVDQCVATSSADSTIKLWAVADCSCVKVSMNVCHIICCVCYIV